MTRLLVPLLLLALVAGCGGGDDEPDQAERARLSDSLGFLATDLGLTAEEVACTAEAIEERAEGADLDELAAEVRRVDAGEVALEDLPADVAATITDSVAACAGS